MQFLVSLRRDLLKLAVTAAVALLGGWLCTLLALPAPYLLGSVFGVWLCGALLPPLRQRLGVARWMHKSLVLGLAVLMGANFTSGVIAQAQNWLGAAALILLATVVATAGAMLYLQRIRNYEGNLALLCSIPGGQAEVVAISRELVSKDYVVALFQLARVSMVFLLAPLILALDGGQDAVDASYVALAEMPSIIDLAATDLAWLLALALGGWALAVLIRMPLPHLLGPLILSAAVHISGYAAIPRVSEFVLLAQIGIGGAIGARLAQVQFAELTRYLGDAVVCAVFLIACYCGFAVALAAYSEVDFMSTILAFIPGGLYEITLLALIFGLDIAFIAFQHTIRILVIYLSLPLVVQLGKR